MNTRIENVFLTYTKHPLRDNPENIYEIIKKIEEYFSFDGNEELRKFVYLMAHLYVKSVKENDPKLCERYYQETIKAKPKMLGNILFVSIMSLGHDFFKYYHVPGSDKKCPPYCLTLRERLLDANLFSEPNRLNCVECDQLFFNHIVNQIVKGQEFDHILGLVSLINTARKVVEKNFGFAKVGKGKPFKTELKEYHGWNPGITHSFTPFLNGSISHCLADFLLHTDRRKLKRCSQCDEFYVAKTVRANQKYCSPKCKRGSTWPPEKWNEYMKSYRKRKSKERKKKYDEMRIQRMLDGGHTRAEAIEILKADKEM